MSTKKQFLSVVLILVFISTFGQRSKDDEDANYYFPENGFRISVRPSLARKAYVTPNNNYHPSASNFISLGAGIDYCYHINKYFSLITGLHGLWHGSNFSFFVAGNEFQPPLGYDIDESGPTSGDLQNALISLQTTLEKKWFTRNNKIWSTGLGLAINYSPLNDFDNGYSASQNGQQVFFAQMSYDASNGRRPFLSAHIMAGRYWKLGKRQSVSTNLVMDYSFRYFAKGYYSFHIPGKPEITGEYKIDGSYFGIDIAYDLPPKMGRNK